MKHVIFTLTAALFFSFGSQATSRLESQSTNISKHSPPGKHYHYRIGSFHRTIPYYAQRVVVNRQVFFAHRGVFFRPTHRGYVVVQKSAVYRNNNSYRHQNRYGNRRPQGRYDNYYRQGGNRSGRCSTPPPPRRNKHHRNDDYQGGKHRDNGNHSRDGRR